jgi:hypothetical protein
VPSRCVRPSGKRQSRSLASRLARLRRTASTPRPCAPGRSARPSSTARPRRMRTCGRSRCARSRSTSTDCACRLGSFPGSSKPFAPRTPRPHVLLCRLHTTNSPRASPVRSPPPQKPGVRGQGPSARGRLRAAQRQGAGAALLRRLCGHPRLACRCGALRRLGRHLALAQARTARGTAGQGALGAGRQARELWPPGRS